MANPKLLGAVDHVSFSLVYGWATLEGSASDDPVEVHLRIGDDIVEMAGPLSVRADLGGKRCGFSFDVPPRYAALSPEEFVKAFRGVAVRVGGTGFQPLPLHKSVLTSFLSSATTRRAAASRKIAFLVRTHLSVRRALALARKLEEVGIGDVLMCVDESAGPVRVGHYRHLSHSSQQLVGLGLEAASEKAALFFYGDMAFYPALVAAPEYDFFLMIEYDVDFTEAGIGWLRSLVKRFADPQIDLPDFFAPSWGVRPSEWHWYSHARFFFPDDHVYGVLFPIIGLSRAAASFLYAQRLIEPRLPKWQGGGFCKYAYCEYFVPTKLMRSPEFLLARAEDVGLPWSDEAVSRDFTSGHPLLQDAPGQGTSMIRHPVLEWPQYLAKLKWFMSESQPEAAWRKMMPYVSALPEHRQSDSIVVEFMARCKAAVPSNT